MQWLLRIIEILSHELWVIAVGALPFLELRAAIPIGLGFGMHPLHAFFLAFLGSLIPVPFILFFVRRTLIFLRGYKLFRKPVDNFYLKIMKKGKRVQKYSLAGLIIFVAVPLPSSGVWSGSAIAAFLNIDYKYALPAIALGNLIAGLIVLGISSHIIG